MESLGRFRKAGQREEERQAPPDTPAQESVRALARARHSSLRAEEGAIVDALFRHMQERFMLEEAGDVARFRDSALSRACLKEHWWTEEHAARFLASLPALRCLRLEYAAFSGALLGGPLPPLSELALERLPHARPELLAPALLALAPSLVRVSLGGCPGVDDAVLSSLRGASSLRHLRLNCLDAPSSRAVRSLLLVVGERLESLELSACPALEDEALLDAAPLLRSLRELDVHASEFGDESLVPLLRGSSRLESLALGDSGASCEALEALTAAGPLALVRLDVAHVNNLAKDSVDDLACAAENLTYLDVSGHNEVDDESMMLLGELRQLHTLRMRDCAAVSMAGLAELISNSDSLMLLDIRDNMQIAPHQKMFLEERCEIEVLF